MDAFFAAVEERDHPQFTGRPIVVGSDPREGTGRGVVSTANYAARAYGIRSALPISRAWKLAEAAHAAGKPAVVFLPVRMPELTEASERVLSIVRSFVPKIEQVSVDEAYLDLSFTRGYRAARELAVRLKGEIRSRERLTASVGIGPNKLIAKIASDAEKPDGLTVVSERVASEFIAPMPVRVIPGIGPKSEARLAELGVRTVAEARRLSVGELTTLFGKFGATLHHLLRGRDDAPVEERGEAKSIGEQETFEDDTLDATFVTGRLAALARGVLEHLAASSFSSFRRVVVTVRFEDFTTLSRSRTLASPARDLATLTFEALSLLTPFLERRGNPEKKRLRLIGVRIERLGA